MQLKTSSLAHDIQHELGHSFTVTVSKHLATISHQSTPTAPIINAVVCVPDYSHPCAARGTAVSAWQSFVRRANSTTEPQEVRDAAYFAAALAHINLFL